MAEISRAELKYFVERQREEIKTLNEIGRILSATTNPQEIIRLASSYLHHAFPVALCSVLSLPQRQLHLIPFTHIAQVDLVGAARLVREATGRLLHRTLTEDESPCPLQASAEASMQPPTPLRSHLFCPLTVKGQVTGTLGLFSGQADAFTKEDEHAVGIVADQLGSALRNAFLLEELRQADEVKNQVLSVVSHELSTPLTAIKEGVNLILEGALGETTADQRDFLGTVDENAQRLERIIQKIKMTTELITGQTKFLFESVDLRTVVANVTKAYRTLAASRGVQLKVLEQPKPLFWQVDAAHLTMALTQVVENAIQATPADGFVTIKLATGTLEAEVQIVDTGCGISKEALPNLFDRFKSVGGINDRKMGGLGLGLFIARMVVDGHGGAITASSTLGEGTLITIKLPKPSTPSA